MVGFAICSYLKTQGPLVASLGLSLLLRSLTTERRRRYLKSCPQVGKSWVFPVKRRFSRVLRVFWKQDKTPENKGEINEIHRKHGGVTQQKQAGSSGKPELTQGWENRNPPFHIQNLRLSAFSVTRVLVIFPVGCHLLLHAFRTPKQHPLVHHPGVHVHKILMD